MKLRSLMIGDCEHYASPYMRGVAQAMRMLGHEHTELSIRRPARHIEQRVRMWKPHVLWTHMLLWPPIGAPPVAQLVDIASAAAKRGARVVIHDGDAKESTRHARDISAWCSLALVNHAYDRSAWRSPTLRWPYFAMAQKAIAPVVHDLVCDVFFAGTLGGGVYAERTKLVEALKTKGVQVKTPRPGENSIDRTPEVAASARTVLGFGRPRVPGWVDTRVFQYPGAGGLLLHDDVQGYLEPWQHFVPYRSGDVESVVEALAALKVLTEAERRAMRDRAFSFVQAEHSAVPRVRQVLATLGVA